MTETPIELLYNDACSKCRSSLEILRESGADFGVVEYLVNPLGRGELSALVDKLDDPVMDLVRWDDPAFLVLGTEPSTYRTNDEIIDLLVQHPALLQRPVAVRGDRALIARPPERVTALFD